MIDNQLNLNARIPGPVWILVVAVVMCSCNKKFVSGYYEFTGSEFIYDSKINNDDIDADDFVQVQSSLSAEQLRELKIIAFDKTMHRFGNLGTCEVIGVFKVEDMEIYTTCGTAQIWICKDEIKEVIMLTDEANERLFQLTRQLRR